MRKRRRHESELPDCWPTTGYLLGPRSPPPATHWRPLPAPHVRTHTTDNTISPAALPPGLRQQDPLPRPPAELLPHAGFVRLSYPTSRTSRTTWRKTRARPEFYMAFLLPLREARQAKATVDIAADAARKRAPLHSRNPPYSANHATRNG
jgi:hypothetical protein